MAAEVIKIEHVSKSFYGNRVLTDISFQISAGEVVSLVGENGAGKSTLMNILFGMDVIKNTGGFDGALYFEGNPVTISSPNDALSLGIGMVHQEFKQIDEFTITENIKLNKEICTPGLLSKPFKNKLDRLDMTAMSRESRKALDNVHLNVDEWMVVAGLSVAHRQFVEIAKALDNRNTKLIIFDEPTAVLTENESKNFLDIVRELSQKGIACLFISHKLEEVIAVSDRILVLRDGNLVAGFSRGETTREELARLMVGREVIETQHENRSIATDDVILSLRNYQVDMPSEWLTGIDLDVYRGEILGIAGLAGSGKLSISNGIRGLYDVRGDVTYNGNPLEVKNTKLTHKKGISFVSEDRKKIGLVLDETIENNCTNTSMITRNRFLKKICGIPVLDKAKITLEVEKMIGLLEIKCVGPKQKVGSLSGGNQQKVCVASMLLQEPEMIFASEPTRGIDIGAKQLILKYLRKINREKGTTVVVTSSELHELRALCDRIAVIADGKLAGILPANAPIEQFGLLMSNIQA